MAKKVKLNLADLNDTDLAAKLKEDKVRLQRLKFNHAVTPLENPNVIKFLRRDIARMMHETSNRRKKATAK